MIQHFDGGMHGLLLFFRRFFPVTNQFLDFGEFLFVQVFALEETLHHRRERAVESMLQGVKQFAALRLFAGDSGVVNSDFAFFFGLENALGNHAVHERADSGIGPTGGFEELFGDSGGGAGFGFPNDFNHGPFGFGQFDGVPGHAGIISTTVEDVKRILYKCSGWPFLGILHDKCAFMQGKIPPCHRAFSW